MESHYEMLWSIWLGDTSSFMNLLWLKLRATEWNIYSVGNDIHSCLNTLYSFKNSFSIKSVSSITLSKSINNLSLHKKNKAIRNYFTTRKSQFFKANNISLSVHCNSCNAYINHLTYYFLLNITTKVHPDSPVVMAQELMHVFYWRALGYLQYLLSDTIQFNLISVNISSISEHQSRYWELLKYQPDVL